MARIRVVGSVIAALATPLVVGAAEEPPPVAVTLLHLQAVAVGQRDYGIELTTDHESLAGVEQILSRLNARYAHHELPPAQAESEARLWGAYFGEVVRRQHRDASWLLSDNLRFRVVFHKGERGEHEFDPVRMIYRWITGPLDEVAVRGTAALAILDCHLY